MKKLFFFFFILIFTLTVKSAFAQVNLDEALANEYYQRGEYDKAAVLYKKLLDNKPGNQLYYDNYLSSLLNLKDYKTAEKELKKLIKKTQNPLKYQVDLGYIYSLDGDEKSMKKVYDEIVDDLVLDDARIRNTAAAFTRRNQTEYAVKTYQRGRKLMKNELAYTYELAELYQEQKEYQKMIDEYLLMLERDPYSFETVKNNIQDIITENEPYDILKKQIIKKVQSNPDNMGYTELLSWLFIQKKDFNSAFIQTRALDKRLKEGGRRLVELARVAADYQEFEMAEKIYQSVLSEGKEAAYYIPAQRGLLDLKYIKVTQTGSYTDADVQAVMQSYQDFINQYGINRVEAGEVVLRLAEIKALYAHQVPQAIELLEKFIGTRVEKSMEARAKLALGDYYLLNNNSWESTLYYGQVEKMYKDHPLGHEAKFRNAKISFYRGEFEWAAAQLEVLKGSTAELIANDALQLALLIQDNLGLDSTEEPLRLYADADLLIYKNQFDDANKKLDSISKLYPAHSLEDDIWMLRATMAMKKRNYPEALGFYEQVYTKYATDILADDALFKAAQLEEKYLNDPEKAKALYEKIILDYKGSVFGVEAKNRYRVLRGDVVN